MGPGQDGVAEVQCPSDTFATGGTADGRQFAQYLSRPLPDPIPGGSSIPTGWEAEVFNPTSTSNFSLFAIVIFSPAAVP